MDCIILAAGRGTRLKPLTATVPKPLISIKGKALIDYIVNILYYKFDKIIIVVDYLSHTIKGHFNQTKFRDKITYVQQIPDKKGTMGALLSAKNIITSDFLVICSDNLYSPSDIDKLLLRKNSFLIKKVTTNIKNEHYKDAKHSLIKTPELSSDFHYHYLEAGAWHLEKEFLDTSPVLVLGNDELGIPQTLYLDYENNPSKYNIIFADIWFPVGTIWELQYINSNIDKIPL